MIDPQHDPDGIAFFTNGSEPHVAGSVFGASAQDRLDALFGHVGSDEASLAAPAPLQAPGSEATRAPGSEATRAPVREAAREPARPIVDFTTAFVLGGPAAISQVGSG